jgi:hypothetical protein
MTKLFTPNRHTGGGRYPDAFEIPGFRVALRRPVIRGLPGMTIELCREFLSHHTRHETIYIDLSFHHESNKFCRILS